MFRAALVENVNMF